MIVADGIIGNIHQDESLGETYETYRREGNVETIHIEPDDRKRSRIRTTTDAGTEIGVVVTDKSKLDPGDVVVVDDGRMIVVEFQQQEALVIEYRGQGDAEALVRATQLGHFIGNRHWNLTLRDGRLYVPLTDEKEFMTDVVREFLPSVAEVGYEYVESDELVERHHRVEDGHDHSEYHHEVEESDD